MSVLQNTTDKKQIWAKYMEVAVWSCNTTLRCMIHMGIERIMLDQNKGYIDIPKAVASRTGTSQLVGVSIHHL